MAKARLYVGAVFVLCLLVGSAFAQVLEVKADRNAILKGQPTGTGAAVGDRLSPGTRVELLEEVPRYYRVRVESDGREGWSYKGNFEAVADAVPAAPTDAQGWVDRKDDLQIVVLDVEVGDSTLIICPEENGQRDVILVDTGEDDGDRIKEELTARGFDLHAKPLTALVVTHYDHDHCGALAEVLPLARAFYDHGDNIKAKYKEWYSGLVDCPEVNRCLMTLDYEEQFSGGVTVECVAINQATCFSPDAEPSGPENDNPNSIALLVSYRGFDYFTGGDLAKGAEQSLAQGIQNCDVYHVNHHGSRTTSSDPEFVKRLDPEVCVASNGTQHGHPNKEVAARLVKAPIKSRFYQTNANPDKRANHPDAKYVADDTCYEDVEEEEAEGALGTIRIVVDALSLIHI